ncbi:MAG: hypothetical protein NXH88_01110 [Hyphomonas sp.]|nr:hypothetical protein [Hyphomonas sp.]
MLYLHCAFGDPPAPVRKTAAAGRIAIIPQAELDAARLAKAHGLVTGNQLDQEALLQLRQALEGFLDAGGRWFFNGHVVRPLIAELEPYQSMRNPKRPDFEQTRLAAHPIFKGIEIAQLETNHGVAGFYGRGANPMPAGAIAVTGLRNGTVPVDWVWHRPGGGRFFSHAGNDLGQAGREWDLPPILYARIFDWTNGGPCLCV